MNIWNYASQVWNHNFFWESMQPDGGYMPAAGLLQQIEKDFGSFQNFREKFITTAMSLFGSGWVWLVCKCALFHIRDANILIYPELLIA